MMFPVKPSPNYRNEFLPLPKNIPIPAKIVMGEERIVRMNFCE